MDLRAVIFVPALVAAALFAFLFAMFAAHYYLTVLEGTAAGAKQITWVSEPVVDNFGKPFYLAWLLVLWLGPAYIIGRSLAHSTQLSWLALAVPIGVAWLLYPVSQLSSLCASSVWIPLHPQVFARLAQRPGATALFFLFTLPVFGLGGLAFRWAFLTEGAWHLLFAGVPLLVFALFLYSRLLGRLAFALLFTRDILRRKKKKRKKAAKSKSGGPDEPDPEPVAADGEPGFAQPGELPPVMTPDEGELVGYNVLIADDAPQPKKRVKAEVVEEAEPEPACPTDSTLPSRNRSQDPARTWTHDDEDRTPYGMNTPEPGPEDSNPNPVVQPRADEMALLDRRDVPKPPKRVWTAEVFVFLGQPGTISAFMILCGLATLAGAAVRVARMFNPAAGGGE